MRFIGGILATMMALALAFAVFSIATSPDQPDVPEAASGQTDADAVTRHQVSDPEFTVDTPTAWVAIPNNRLHELDSLGMLAGTGMQDAVLLTVANANTDPNVKGIVMFIDAGPKRGNTLEFMQNLEQIMVNSLANSPLSAARVRLKDKAKSVEINGIPGARVGFSGQTDYGPVTMTVFMLELDGRAVLMNTVSVTGSEQVETVKQVVASIRPGGS